MRKVSPSSVHGSTMAPLRSGLAAACLLVSCVGAQEPEAKPGTAAAVQRSVAELEELVAKAEALAKSGDQAAVREACKAALAVARPGEATPEWLAAADGVLWRLGLAAYRAGELRAAQEAWSAVHQHREATLPDDHPELQAARGNLAITRYMLGDLRAAAQLNRSGVAGALRRLSSQKVSLRDINELARQVAAPLSDVNSLLDLGDRLPADIAAGLRHDGLQLLDASRSAELHAARLRDVVRQQAAPPRTASRSPAMTRSATRPSPRTGSSPNCWR